MGHAAPGWLNRPVIHRRRQPLFGSRLPKANFQRPWPVPDYQVYSIGCGNVGGRARGHLQKSPCPFKTGHPERWPSGLRRTLGKRVCGKPYRGFESHSLRQLGQGRVFSRRARIEDRESRFQLWRSARQADHRTLLRIFDERPFSVLERQHCRGCTCAQRGGCHPPPSAAMAAPECFMRLHRSIIAFSSF
jgi:hypothetical protein